MKGPLLFACLGSASLCSMAAAQTDILEKVFARYDKNKDGHVVASEYPGSPAQFAALDADGDGKVNRKEFAESRAGRQLVRARNRDANAPRKRVDLDGLARRRLEQFARFDRNGDGRVSEKEWTGAPLAFRTLDLDGNGVIDARDRGLAPRPREEEDLATLLGQFKTYVRDPKALLERHDKNKDGELSRGELRSTKLVALFDRADANGDGQLDTDELTRAAGAINAAVSRRNQGSAKPRAFRVPFGAWDRNNDGRIDSNEWVYRKALFPRVDADRDGGVTKAEVARYERSVEGDTFLERFDLNDDGRVTLEEFGGSRDAFRRADRNNDGSVSARDR